MEHVNPNVIEMVSNVIETFFSNIIPLDVDYTSDSLVGVQDLKLFEIIFPVHFNTICIIYIIY